MKLRTFTTCIVLGLFVFALSFAMLQQPVHAQSSTATPTSSIGDFGLITITGNVRDVYGPTQICCEPTAGVSITVRSTGEHGTSSGSATTDASGNYSVSNIHLYDTDTVTVTASKLGFPTSSIVRSAILTNSNKVFDFTLVAATPTPTATRTPTGPTPTRTRTPTVTPVSTNNDVPGPDLTVSSITYLGSSPACANSPKIQVVVANIGTLPTNGSFSVNLNGGVAQTVQGLAAGQSVTLIFAASSNTATADSTNSIVETNETNNSLSGNFGIPTQAPTCTPSNPTFTPTGPTPTRTRTVTPSPTPTLGTGACSPVTSTITAPFSFDGAGTFCWQSTNLGTYINSWSTTSVTLNGVNVTNMYIPSGSYPAKIGGFWYVSYNSPVAWGHFEAK